MKQNSIQIYLNSGETITIAYGVSDGLNSIDIDSIAVEPGDLKAIAKELLKLSKELEQ